ncbi:MULTISPECIES: DUF4834 family protein [Prevotella]|uniref:DUF4834 family protein n=1 Tax=Prevotella melaninogenica TaxID=28132 RepID=A0ABX7XTQ7_9BACT|nr:MULTISPECIES: DUF4834 family protein [Prevotella]QUB76898.1 DUF4834 family protein [Prevotella melaninogenica]
MSIIAFLLKFAFFIFFTFLVLILWVAYVFYKQITRARRQFNPNDYQYQEPSSTENTIIDNRPMEERRKQVIPDSEGEYVDFTESDDTKS